MVAHKFILLGLVAAPLLVSGCADNGRRSDTYSSSPQVSSSSYTDYGVVEQIDVVSSEHRVGAGAVIGGVVGGLLGNQVGAGSGKTAATVVGVVGGAVVGNEIQKRRNSDESYRVLVKIEHGGRRTLEQKDIGDLRVGDHVRIRDDLITRD
jgi:outer membrane lipoprotein SlyB